MSMGVQYVRLAADEASLLDSNVISDGRTPTGGFYVNWDTDGGFTNLGWDIGWKNNGPFFGLNQQEVQTAIDGLPDGGNLNTQFQTWEQRVPDPIDRLDWMLNSVGGCIENASV